MIAVVLGRRSGRPAVVSRRAAAHHRHLGQGRTCRLRGHRRQRTGRHERDRHLWAALQQRKRQYAAAPVLPGEASSGCATRSTRPRHSSFPRWRRSPHPTRPSPPRLTATSSASLATQTVVEQRLRQCRHQGHLRPRYRRRALAPPTGPIPVLIATELTTGPQRGARRRPHRQPRLLRHRLHQATAFPRRRPVLLQCRHRRPFDVAPSGES